MGMIINQEYMNEEVIKPINKRMDKLEKLIKNNEKLINTAIHKIDYLIKKEKKVE